MSSRDTVIFVTTFLAIIPLAKLLGFVTEELSLRVGHTLAGLLNVTLGNAVELIVAILALVKCQLQVVQSSLVGSILSNLLLVLGMCFFVGGVKYSEQGFGVGATEVNSPLLTISVIAVLLPAAFHFSTRAGTDGNASTTDNAAILSLSHGVAIILLFIYAVYLFFQFYSHADLYNDAREHNIAITNFSTVGLGVDNGTIPESPTDTDEEEEEEELMMSLWMAIGLLVVVMAVITVTAKFLVDSIDGLTEGGHISKEFVGLILLPIVGNAAEPVMVITVSIKDRLNLSLGVAVGSSIQIALFVIPFIVTLAWILGKPLPLLFNPYESVVLFLTALAVNYVVQDRKSNWLEGFVLMCLYVILAVSFWYYVPADSALLGLCK